MYSKSKDGFASSFSTHIDTAMKNAPGANNLGLHGHETYREYAEVFREYLEISIKGVNFLKSKRQLLNTMGTSYDEY